MKKSYAFLILLFFALFLSCSEDGSLTEGEGLTDGAFSSESGGSGDTGGSGNGGSDNAGIITAGEWNDLSNWSFWQNLLNQEVADKLTTNWEFNTANRYSFELKDENSLPVVDAVLTIKEGTNVIWSAKTDNLGTAELWIDLKSKNQKTTDISNYSFYLGNQKLSGVKPFSEGINTIKLNSSAPVYSNVDLAFIVDATGSMGDEMNFLKDDLKQVIQKVKAANTNLQISTGTVFYRDIDDEYLVKKSDFTLNLENTLTYINAQSADGGGDFPEAVHTALKTSIDELQWATTAKTRIAFLLLDAPPHEEAQIIDDLHTSIKKAAQKGIKIIPIVASGINKETEFLMRNFSIATNGTYVFITNDSGVGNDHLEPTVGDYDVEILQELMIRLITKYTS
ncbi:VWA domain-containing protein [Leeuwenhoekiella polynyae]|uniref:von Willebrand factor type A domain-containing protein n=1 Tax=Leeuwenhoekiella polynyae TaxID=1550906 RepID=A0A4Q0PGV7_9FLAO|nr:vWA domain-containing protein [Leeuwenhoekiella polynyae]RXG26186.1 von Willebrand factor type A domain-containing protein [Leeuwenhoekiella polynyae]